MAKKIAKKKDSKGKIAAEIGAGLMTAGAAAAAGYYLYGSKNAKKNRKAVTKEIKADWKIVKSEAKKAQKTGRVDVSRAKSVGKKVLAHGKKTVAKAVKKAIKKSGIKVRKNRS